MDKKYLHHRLDNEGINGLLDVIIELHQNIQLAQEQIEIMKERLTSLTERVRVIHKNQDDLTRNL